MRERFQRTLPLAAAILILLSIYAGSYLSLGWTKVDAPPAGATSGDTRDIYYFHLPTSTPGVLVRPAKVFWAPCALVDEILTGHDIRLISMEEYNRTFFAPPQSPAP